MNIYNANNEVIASVVLDSNAVHEEELMKGNFVRLSWYESRRRELPVGAYIIPFDDGVRYTLFDPYAPGRERHKKFNYKPEFQHPVMWLGRIPFIHLQGDISSWATATKKYDWTYTGYAGTLAAELVQYINWLSGVYPAFGNIFGTGWTAAVSNDLASTKTCSFASLDILSAVAEMAGQWDCEYHFDFVEKKLRFGTVSYNRDGISTTQLLKSGENVQVASVSESKEGYYNSFVVLGSTKNLSQQNAAGENVQVTERLTLSSDYPDSMIYVDNDGMELTRAAFLAKGLPLLTKELVLDDVYPKLQLYVYSVRERRMYHLDDNGNKIADNSFGSGYREYSVWYLRLAQLVNGKWMDYIVKDEDRIADTELQISFLPNYDSSLSSPLTGRTFGLVPLVAGTEYDGDRDVNGTGISVSAGDYRIEFEDGDLIIPTTKKQGLYPRTVASNEASTDNNIVSIIGVMVSEDMKKTAQDELKAAAMEDIARLFTDLNTYMFKSNAVAFRKSNPQLHVGQAVMWDDGQDLNGGTSYILSTHVRKLVTRLDHPEIVEISIGNEKVKGTISTMKEQIETIIAGGYGSGDGGGLTESQFLQLLKTYGRTLFLSKTQDDTAQGLIGLLKGATFGPASDLWGYVREVVENGVSTAVAWFRNLKADVLEVAGLLRGGGGTLHVEGDVDVAADADGNGGNISAGGDLSGRDVRARGDLTVTGNATIGGTTTMDTATARDITTETLTVTKSAHFFELILDQIKAAGGSLILSPADGFRVDAVQQKAVRETDYITYGNGLGCADKMENYIVCEPPIVNVGDTPDDFLHCPFKANTEATFEYTTLHDGVLIMYRYNANWSSWQAEYMPAGSDEWEAQVWPASQTMTSRSLSGSTGVLATQSSSNYVCYYRLVRAGDRIRITGLATTGRSVVFGNFREKYGVAGFRPNNQLLMEAVVRNANLNHMSSTSNTNQRRKLDYRTGELWSTTYGEANTYYVSAYIDVTDVETITFRLLGVSTNGAHLCAYDEDFNYIQENSVAQPNVTTEITWTKAAGTRWVRLSLRWTGNKDSYYIYLNNNRTEPQTVRWLYLPYCEFQNVQSVKIYADLRNRNFKNPDVLVFDGVAAKDQTGRGGLYDRLSDRLFTGINDDYAGGTLDGDILQSLGTRLLWRATESADGTGKAIRNMWRAGDQAICQTFNAAEGTSFDIANKYWWTVVTETGTTQLPAPLNPSQPSQPLSTSLDSSQLPEDPSSSQPIPEDASQTLPYHYIDIGTDDTDGTLDCEEGDEVAMLGHRGDDPERQGAVYMAAYNSIDSSARAPMIGIYAGINDFQLASHRVALVSPTAVSFLSELFRMESRGGGEVPQMNMRGAWTPGMSCTRWDAVSYDGEIWLCILPAGATTTQPPSAAATETVEGTAVPAWELLVAHGADGQPGANGTSGDKGDPGEKGDKGDKGDDGTPGIVLSLDNDADAVQLRTTGGEYDWETLTAWTGSATTRTLNADGLYTTGSNSNYRVYWLRMSKGDTLRFTGLTTASKAYCIGYSADVPVLNTTVLTHYVRYTFAKGVAQSVEWTAPADGYAVLYRHNSDWSSVQHTLGRLSAATALVGSWPETTARILEGDAAIDNATTNTALNDPDVIVWSKEDDGCTSSATLSADDGSYRVTLSAIDADRATVTIRARYRGLALSKVFTVVRLVDADKYELRLTRESVVYDPATASYDATGVDVPEVWVRHTDGTTEQLLTMNSSIQWLASNGSTGTFDADGTPLPLTVLDGASWLRFWLLPEGFLDAVPSPLPGSADTYYDNAPWLDREEMAVVSNGRPGTGTNGRDAVLLTLEPQVVEITEHYEITAATSSADSLIRTWLDVGNGDVLTRATVTVGGVTAPATVATTDASEFVTYDGDAVKLADQATLLRVVSASQRPMATVLVTIRATVGGETYERSVPLTIYVNRLGKTVSETIGDVTATLRTRGYVTESGMENYTNTRIESAEGTLQQWAHDQFDHYGSDISSLNTRVSTAEGNISTVSQRVNGIETDVSEISQKADSIESTVSGMKIGGRNLLLNSDFAEVSSGTPTHFYYARTAFNSRTAITSNLPTGFTTGLQLVASQTTCVLSMVNDSTAQPYMKLPTGSHFLLSFWVKTSVGGVTVAVTYKSQATSAWSGTGVVVATQRTAAQDTWERMVFPIDGRNFSPASIHIGPQQTCTISLTGLQLEEGTIPTDWRRAEDDLTQWKSEITQLADRMDLAVKKDDVEQCGMHLDGEKGTVTLTGKQTIIDGDLDVRGLFTNAVREIRWGEKFSDGYEWPDGATAQQYKWSVFVHGNNGTMVVPIDLSEVKSVKLRGINGAMSVNQPTINTHPIVILPAYDKELVEGMPTAYPVGTVQESGVRLTVTNSIHLRYRKWKNLEATGSSTALGLAVWNASALLCADARLLRYASYQSGSGMPTPTATVQAAGTNPSIKSCFVANGDYAKFLALPPGQTVTLVSSVEWLSDNENAVPYIVWYVENAEAFACVRSLMTVRLVNTAGNVTGEKNYLFTEADHYSSLGILAPPGLTIPAANASDDSTRSVLIELQQGQWPQRIGEHETAVY